MKGWVGSQHNIVSFCFTVATAAEKENDAYIEGQGEVETEPVLAVRRSARRAKLTDKFTNIPSEDSNSAGSRRSKRLQDVARRSSPQAKRRKGTPGHMRKSSTPYKKRSRSVQKSPSASPVRKIVRSTSVHYDRRQAKKHARSSSILCDRMMGASNVNSAKKQKTHPCNSSVSIGTQTQGSTYRIKASELGKLKKLVVPLERVDSKPKATGSQSQIVFNHSPDRDGDGISMRSTTQEAQCYKRDRALIQQEELEEEMKLQQLALKSSAQQVASKSTAHAQSGAVNLKRRNLHGNTERSPPRKRRSFFQAAWDGLTTPIKNWFS